MDVRKIWMTMIAVGVSIALIGCAGESSDGTGTADDGQGTSMADKLADAADKAGDKAGEWADKAQEKGGELYEESKKTAGELADKTGEMADDAMEKSKELADQAGEKASEWAGQAGEKAGEWADAAKKAGSDAIASFKTDFGEVEGRQAPAFTLMDHNGNAVSLDDFKDQVVVLEWFNPQCPFVVRHYEKMPTMKDTSKKWSEQGVVWLAINSSHFSTVGFNKDWAAKWDINYQILDDASGKVGHAYGAKTTPHMFIIAPGGTIVYEGAIDSDRAGNQPASERVNYVDQALTQLFNGEPVTMAETKAYGCSVKYAK